MHDSFAPTPTMVERHLKWVDAVVEHVWITWSEKGEVAADTAKAGKCIQVVRAELMVAHRPEWMHPLDSIAVLTGTVGVPEGVARADLSDALRTSSGIGEQGRAKWAAQAMGVSVATVKKYVPDNRPPRSPMDRGRTAVYRHFDRFGKLLYIGIAKDPDHRLVLHAYTSEWHSYVADSTHEWFDTREQALTAERIAIQTERPMFNVVSSVVDPDDAEDYLMFLELFQDVPL